MADELKKCEWCNKNVREGRKVIGNSRALTKKFCSMRCQFKYGNMYCDQTLGGFEYRELTPYQRRKHRKNFKMNMDVSKD